jgi:hypothetical protein
MSYYHFVMRFIPGERWRSVVSVAARVISLPGMALVTRPQFKLSGSVIIVTVCTKWPLPASC